MNYEVLLSNLKARRFLAALYPSAAKAAQAVLDIVGSGSCGIAGSKTVVDLGLYEALTARGNTVWSHTFAPPGKKEETRLAAMRADVFLCSANAITESGTLVNIDGTGNRVAGMLFGPETVVVVAGKNKIAENYEAAMRRIRRDCCPNNARRLGLDTPCARTGICADCKSPARMCNVVTVQEYPTRHVKAFHVLLVDEELGW